MADSEPQTFSPEDLMGKAYYRTDAFLVMPGTLEELYCYDEVKADFIEEIIYFYGVTNTRHERLFGRTVDTLYSFVRQEESGLVLGSRTPIAFGSDYHPMPDILFLAKDNPARMEPDRIVGVPDLVIEILSPSTRRIDLVDKRQFYRQYGVRELYFIDMANGELVIDCLKDGEYETFTRQTGSFESRVLPGLVWDAAQLLNA
jgi:Uma2 family endonuclease